MSTPSFDCHLLFGLLAMQNGFISRDDLLAALTAWLERRTDPLAAVLCERGALTPHCVELIEALVGEHVARTGNARASLAALPLGAAVQEGLLSLPDEEVQTTLTALPTAAGWWPKPPPAPLPPPPPVVVRFHKLRLHAKGGLGEVHVAQDEELEREVALKEIQNQHADHPDFRGRFVREARITGHLEHPGIVPVYGMGSYPDGRPYYAMRLIKGSTLHDAISLFHQADRAHRDQGERELALRGLLTRFVAVCQAVAYAHSRGVVHRDLKPANVMLGEFGETLVVDWGLAKTIHQSEASAAVDHAPLAPGIGSAPTLLGEAVGTPSYMPPEQARGELGQIGPSSDVFALGATLYHLLTGRPPYLGDLLGLLADAAEGRYRPARQANRRVPAALAAICDKAMARRPAERYTGAKELAADVERWLADEPVRAQREPLVHKARRWARRHQALVSGGAALLMAGVVGLVIGLGAVRAEKARTEEALGVAEKAEREAKANLAVAEDNFKLARQVVDDCFGIARHHPLLNQHQLSDELHQLRRLLLEKALPFYKQFRARRPDDRAVGRDLWDQHHRVGYIQNELGSKAEALVNFRLAEGVARELGSREELADTLNDLSVVLRDLGRPAEALGSCAESARLRRALADAQPDLAAHRNGLALTLNNLSALQTSQGRPQEALASAGESARLARTLVAAHPGEPAYREVLANTLHNLAVLQKDQGQSKQSLASCVESAHLSRALAASYPNVPAYREGLARTLFNLGSLQTILRQPEEALKSYRESARLRRGLARAQPGVPLYREGLALALHNQGALQQRLGRREEAVGSFTESAAVRRALVRAKPGSLAERKALALTLSELAQAQFHLGVLYNARGQRDRAEQSYTASAVLFRELARRPAAGPGHRSGLATTLSNLGALLNDLRRPEEALKVLGESAEVGRALLRSHPADPDHRLGLALALNNQGIALLGAGRREEALRSYAGSIDLYRELVQAHPTIASYQEGLCRPLLNRAVICRRLGLLDRARVHLDDALAILARLRLPSFSALAHRERARVLVEQGKPRASLPDWDQALALVPASQRAAVRLERSDALARAGEHDRAAGEAAALSVSPSLSGEDLYNLACIFSLCAGGAGRDAMLPLPLRARRTEERARRAVALLRRAAGAGYFRDQANVTHTDKDADLESLRHRADYRAFVAGLLR